ncbi:MAG: Gfo/Idh/MocA family oxidoreductase [Acidobacteriota bacterium]
MNSITRRDFAKLSALTLAATRLPAQTPEAAPIGFAAVGLGTISGIFSSALPQSQKAKLTAVVTGHPDTKGKAYTSQYNLTANSIYTYETYNSIRDNKAIDAVYIGLPNSMHAEYTIRAAEAGKHVLCEKPMAISSAECRRMIDACRAANVHLMIAYRIWYDPTFAQVLQLLRDGAIGQVQSFHGQFIANFPAGAWRLNKALAGGGCLFDLGIYPINTMRYLAGEDPTAYTAVTSTRETGPRFSTMEQSIEFTLKFPSGIIASGSSSYGANGPNTAEVRGDKGWLRVEPAYGYDGVKVTGRTINGPVDITATGKKPFQFLLEADHFADCIRANTTPKTPGELGLKDLVTIETLYRAAGAPLV